MRLTVVMTDLRATRKEFCLRVALAGASSVSRQMGWCYDGEFWAMLGHTCPTILAG
jgi:hypothetical protein